jgi:hypothetical protein
MNKWRALRDEFGDELHRLDSRGDMYLKNASCAICHTRSGVSVRCMDCSFGRMLCSSCMCTSHRFTPFHHIEVRFATLVNRTFYRTDALLEMVRWVLWSYIAVRPGRYLLRWSSGRHFVRERAARSDIHGHSHQRAPPRTHRVLRL